MQKEGLHERTLTLKLKTASFEIRTRAVTLQKYIFSSEDILKHASVLLKSELPVSLRLIGLRVSQFLEDKVNAPSDPSQKTLTDFIMSRDSPRKNFGGQISMGSDISDHHSETSSSFCVHEMSQNGFRDLFVDIRAPDMHENSCTLSGDAIDINRIDKPSSNDVAGLDNYPDKIDHTLKSLQQRESQLLEQDPSTSCHFRAEDQVSNVLEGEDVSSSNHSDQVFWVDDYKCSFVAELPPTFVKERQEYSDFHLAERLQKEESGTNSSFLIPRRRSVSKDESGSHG